MTYRAIRNAYEEQYGAGAWKKIEVPKEVEESEAKPEKLGFGAKVKLSPAEHHRYTEAKKRLAGKLGMQKEGWGLYGRSIMGALKNKKKEQEERSEKSMIADDGKPGKSLKETSTEELKATLAKLKPTDPGAEGRIKAIKGELASRSGGGMEKAKQPSESTSLTPEKARQMLHERSGGHGRPITEQQRKFFGAVGGHLPAPGGKAKKSMNYEDLDDFLEKGGIPWGGMTPKGYKKVKGAGGKAQYIKPGEAKKPAAAAAGKGELPKGARSDEEIDQQINIIAMSGESLSPEHEEKQAAWSLKEGSPGAYIRQMQDAAIHRVLQKPGYEVEAVRGWTEPTGPGDLGQKTYSGRFVHPENEAKARAEAKVAARAAAIKAGQALKGGGGSGTFSGALMQAAKDNPSNSAAHMISRSKPEHAERILENMAMDPRYRDEATALLDAAEKIHQGGMAKSMGDVMSLDDYMEKARKGTPIGGVTPSGKYRRTASGYEPVAGKKTEQNKLPHAYGTMDEHTKDIGGGKQAVIRGIFQPHKGDSYHVRVEHKDSGKTVGRGATHDVYLADHGGDHEAALAEAKKKHAELHSHFSAKEAKAQEAAGKKAAREKKKAAGGGSKRTAERLDKKPAGTKMSIDFMGETYGAEKMKSGQWQVWTESGAMGRESMGSDKLASLVDQAKKADKAKKSMDGIEGLEDYLEKSGGLPTHEQGLGHAKSSSVEGGSADGGELADVGRTSGSSDSAPGPEQDSQGQLKGVSPGGKQKLSEDDAEEEKQMTEHKKPIETIKKSRFPADQRDSVAHEQAAAVSRLQKSEDVYVGPDRHPFSHYATHASGDLEASEMVKSEGFYHGKSPQFAPSRPIIEQGVLCKSVNASGCGETYSAALTSCPSCGAGTVGHRHLPGGAAVGAETAILEKSVGPGSLLRRPTQEPDVKIG